MNNKYNNIYNMNGGKDSSNTNSTDSSEYNTSESDYDDSTTTTTSDNDVINDQNIDQNNDQNIEQPLKSKTNYEEWLDMGNIGSEQNFLNSKNKKELKTNIISTDPAYFKQLEELDISIFTSPKFNSEMINILIEKLNKDGDGLNIGIFIKPKYFNIFKKYGKFKNTQGTHINILNNPIKNIIFEFINLVGIPGTEIEMKIKYMLIDDNTQLLYVNFEGPITNFTGDNLYSITLSKNNMKIKNPKFTTSTAKMIGPLDIKLIGTVQLFK